MIIDSIVRIVTGFFILISLALGVPASPVFISAKFLWCMAFAGAALLQSGFTGFCILEIMLKKMLGK